MAELDIDTGDTSVSGTYRRKYRRGTGPIWLATGAIVVALVAVIAFIAWQPAAVEQGDSLSIPVVDPLVEPVEPVEVDKVEPVEPVEPIVLEPAAPTDLEVAIRRFENPAVEPAAPSQPAAEAPAKPPPLVDAALTPTPAPPPGADSLRELCDSGELFREKGYTELRRIFAERFAYDHAPDLATDLDDDTRRWLDEHGEIKEEFYTAIDPEHDDVSAALGLFARLRREYPDSLPAHWNLAVAVALVWDDNPRAIYDYAHHGRRVHASLPDGQLDAVGNYQYLLETNSGKYLPWEFLIYTVDHRTPLVERQWAVANYLGKARMFGKCYSDVPYDHGLIASNESVAALAGQSYTLPNLLQFGGVCAHQADFASRVGKSLGIPAVYAGGEARNQDQHAWVMWVELEAVGPNNIAFHLESAGRYRDDKYYVGDTRNPQTGQPITDRQLELALQTVGNDRRAKRQTDLAMAAYPELAKSESFDVLDRLKFVAAVTELSPGNTDAWRELAKLAGTENLTRGQLRVLQRGIDQLFTTFRGVPDFTWEVFDDLTRCEPVLKKRIGLYNQLIRMYVNAVRPDLASRARLRQVELYEELGESIAAARALAPTILAFADDGRYAPKMFDRMVEICQPLEGGAEFLDKFYPQYLRKIPTHRGRTPSPYAKQMYRQAIEWYTTRNRPDLVVQLQQRLGWLEKGAITELD